MDMEMTAMEKEVYTHKSLEKKQEAWQGKARHRASQEAEREETLQARAFTVVSMEGMGEAGEAGLGLASWSIFSRFWV